MMTVDSLQVRRGRKFAQVLDGARSVFLARGFEGASVDDIAREAGVSKATLYSYFPDKRLLFCEVVQAECLRHADEAACLIDDTAPISEVLLEGARRLTGFMISEFSLRIFRICVAEGERFPELGLAYYRAGPMMVRERLGGFLADAVARGDLVIADPGRAADEFAALCKAGLYDRAIFGAPCEGDPGQEAETVARSAVAMFLARYQPHQITTDPAP